MDVARAFPECSAVGVDLVPVQSAYVFNMDVTAVEPYVRYQIHASELPE